ncbi:MAG: hypothetical protein B7733_09415 [Myxococcales bacterium FL481]|nr:MAG: hypothetical protein B7733_09415 [Myxococcales bacterium FL481]
MNVPNHVIVSTPAPAEFTLARMGATAKEAADTQTVREWASRLAARAPPRDYPAMLEQIYNDIIDRWRYVPESEEWIHGTASSLLAHVLGTKYNAPNQDPTSIDMRGVSNEHKGWGDCDDVATLVAAAVRAIGMTPFFRVARGASGAHVSVLARTPDGELVSVDPVGHPRHPFGWALQTGDVRLFDLSGRPSGPHAITASLAKTSLRGDDMQQGTFYADATGRPTAVANHGHWAATHAGDGRGPRALALPMREWKLFRRGIAVDGCPAFDDNGNSYTYDGGRDLWLDDRLMATRLAARDERFGGIGRRAARRRRRAARRARGSARRKGRRARRRRIVQRVAQRVRPFVSRLMNSRVAQRAVSTALAATGAPPALTRGVMTAGAQIIEQGGLPALLRTLRKDPRKAALLVAQAAKAGAVRSASPFSGDCASGQPVAFMMRQNGSAPFYTQPVVALSGVPGLYSLGALEVTATPMPGQWYRIQRGDTLLTVAQRAWNDRKSRLKHSKWINAAEANAVFHRDTKAGFEANQYGSGIISFLPRYADDPMAASRGESGRSFAVIWIPEAPGDEPPEPIEPDVMPEAVEPAVPDLVEPEIEPEPPVEPETPDLPPDEPEAVEPDVSPPPMAVEPPPSIDPVEPILPTRPIEPIKPIEPIEPIEPVESSSVLPDLDILPDVTTPVVPPTSVSPTNPSSIPMPLLLGLASLLFLD